MLFILWKYFNLSLDTIKERRLWLTKSVQNQKSGREGKRFLSISMKNFIGSITGSTGTPYLVLGKIAISKNEGMKLRDGFQTTFCNLSQTRSVIFIPANCTEKFKSMDFSCDCFCLVANWKKKTRIQDKIRKNSCEKTYGVDSGSKNIFIINNKYILTSEKSFCPELFIHNDSRFRNSVTFNTWPATKTRTDLAWKSDGIGLVNSNVDIFFRNILLKSFDWAVPDWEGTTEEEDLGEGIAKEIVAPKTRYVCTL